ncbi:MAG: YceH family protein [Pseudomonadota bacterium]
MDILLDETELRVLGCLLEKEMATPEYYPLSLNALVNACNQKSNREPVVSYDETTVIHAVQTLKDKRFAVQSDASRVPKYGQNFSKIKNLLRKEAALLCLLLLRGAQTVGELRGRSERLYEFVDLADVERTLNNLIDMEYVVRLPRQPGRKESRFAHLLGGEVKIDEDFPEPLEPGSQNMPDGKNRITVLEEEINAIRTELEALKETFENFKKQFE